LNQVDEKVLVLNVNYEPLNVCTTRRAMGLLMLDKAVIVSNGRGIICTPSKAYPRPSVIRLGYMVHRPRPRVKLTKQEIFQRDNDTCQYCGRTGLKMTIDHVVPRHRGGEYSWTNLVTACADCNRAKGGRLTKDTPLTLLRQPFEPPASAAYLYRRYLENNQDWGPYLDGW
jgi:5-methylcytosine-specific restriction endonuclease McrA